MKRFIPLVALTLAACGARSEAPAFAPSASGPQRTRAAAGTRAGLEQTAMEEDGLVAGVGDATATVSRQIRTGHVAVVVDDYAPFARELDAWLGEAGGFVADASLSHTEGEVSWASLTVRVPAERLDGLVGWTEERVRVESLSITNQDVTAEWVDVEARIENQRRAEARLQQLLADNTGVLADVLAVERELTRVRGEIEAAEGHMRVLSDRVGLATLQLEVRVNTPYAALVAPTFGEEAADVFSTSIAAMGTTARGLALVGIAVLPWLTPPALVLLGAVTLVRRRKTRMAV